MDNPPDQNRLLASLQAAARERLQPRLEEVPLSRGQTLHHAGEPVRYVYFPTTGLVSLLAVTASGGLVELATVDNGGVVGLPLVLHDGIAPYQATVQVAGTALRLRADVVDAELKNGTDLREVLHRSATELLTDMSRTVICLACHEALQRICRWLLTTSDRLGTNTLAITQDRLAQALAVQRPSVTRVTRELREAEAIRCCHGRMEILNRALLERSACECYRPPRTGRPHDARPSPTTPDRRVAR
jgi:CRP-like cAMP-binding protein